MIKSLRESLEEEKEELLEEVKRLTSAVATSEKAEKEGVSQVSAVSMPWGFGIC